VFAEYRSKRGVDQGQKKGEDRIEEFGIDVK
jgi:hypothetical protein